MGNKGGSHKQSRNPSLRFQPRDSTFMVTIILSCKQRVNKSPVWEGGKAELGMTGIP